MKKQKQANRSRLPKAKRGFRAGVFLAAALFAAGVVTAIARHESGRAVVNAAPVAGEISVGNSGKNLVIIEVAGKKLQVDAERLQQGPLTQDESQKIADALKDNKSTEGLAQIQHDNGAVSMDLQGRFQNVMLAKKNDDGSVAAACVDNPEEATAFLSPQANGKKSSESVPGRKAVLHEQ
jgi:hypothetical protein